MRDTLAVGLGAVLFVAGLGLGASGQLAPAQTRFLTSTSLVMDTLTETQTQTLSTFMATETRTITRELPAVQPCFSPGGGCAALLVAWLDRANQTVYVLVYVFTSDALGDALIDARNRGVDVRVVVERQEAGVLGSEVDRLRANGIEVRLDGNPALMHHKVAIVDGSVVMTGSYNWSAAAEHDNDENLVIFRDPELGQTYERVFWGVWGLATP